MKWHKLRSHDGREQMGKRALYRESSVVGLGVSRVVYYSYSTPILAWVHGAGWLRNPRKYSVTTTRHMGYALKDAGYPIVTACESDEAFRLAVFGGKTFGGGRID